MSPVEPGQTIGPGETAETLEVANAQAKDPLVVLEKENADLKAELVKAKQESYDGNALALDLERANKTIEELTLKVDAYQTTNHQLSERNTEIITEYNDMAVQLSTISTELAQLKGTQVLLRDDTAGTVTNENTENANLDADGNPVKVEDVTI